MAKSRQTNETVRRRENARAHAKGKAWYRYYRGRIRAGLEACRRCGRGYDLRFGHLVAHVNGGPYRKDNLTILCWPCDLDNREETIVDIPSLEDEEMAAGINPRQVHYPADLSVSPSTPQRQQPAVSTSS